jgi:hypothetical protein
LGAFLENNLSAYLEKIHQLFYVEMERKTSGCLFGSAATDDWVPARSDLDLLVLMPEEKIELLGRKLTEWKLIPKNPLLDGYALFSRGNIPMVKRFWDYDKAALPTTSIWLMDLWSIKNRSKNLFGQDLKPFIREISQEELQAWAIQNIKNHLIPHIKLLLSGSTLSPETKMPVTPLILIGSEVARVLTLVKGNICSSKREALRWLADGNPEIREMVNQIREDYEKPDEVAIRFTASQAFTLLEFYLRLLREV